MKKVFIVLLAMVFAFSLAACGSGGSDGGGKDGDSGKDKKVERVTTKSGAISVEALDMPDYITEADDDDEEILMAKEGEGYGVGEYVLISGIYSPGVSSAKKQFRSKKTKVDIFFAYKYTSSIRIIGWP